MRICGTGLSSLQMRLTGLLACVLWWMMRYSVDFILSSWYQKHVLSMACASGRTDRRAVLTRWRVTPSSHYHHYRLERIWYNDNRWVCLKPICIVTLFYNLKAALCPSELDHRWYWKWFVLPRTIFGVRISQTSIRKIKYLYQENAFKLACKMSVILNMPYVLNRKSKLFFMAVQEKNENKYMCIYSYALLFILWVNIMMLGWVRFISGDPINQTLVDMQRSPTSVKTQMW